MHKTIPSQLTLLRCCSSLARRWWQAALQPQQPSSGRTEALEDGLNSTREPAAGGASSGNGAVVGAPPVSRNLAARRPVLFFGDTDDAVNVIPELRAHRVVATDASAGALALQELLAAAAEGLAPSVDLTGELEARTRRGMAEQLAKWLEVMV